MLSTNVRMKELTQITWHQLPAEEATGLLGVDVVTGLAADEVARRQKEFGRNRVTAKRGTPAWLKFLRQFNQPLVYTLLAAVGGTAFLGEWVDSSVIFGVVVINAIFGFLQEAKAEQAIDSVSRLVATENSPKKANEERFPVGLYLKVVFKPQARENLATAQ